jgi:hypothetical protein
MPRLEVRRLSTIRVVDSLMAERAANHAAKRALPRSAITKRAMRRLRR